MRIEVYQSAAGRYRRWRAFWVDYDGLFAVKAFTMTGAIRKACRQVQKRF